MFRSHNMTLQQNLLYLKLHLILLTSSSNTFWIARFIQNSEVQRKHVETVFVLLYRLKLYSYVIIVIVCKLALWRIQETELRTLSCVVQLSRVCASIPDILTSIYIAYIWIETLAYFNDKKPYEKRHRRRMEHLQRIYYMSPHIIQCYELYMFKFGGW
jgi:hypothetical protein